MTLYEILQVSRQASRKQIKEAYYNLSKQVHPDINHSKDSKDFVEISRAYSILSNADSRREYDSTLQKKVYQQRTRMNIYDHKHKIYRNDNRGSFNHSEWVNQHYPYRNHTPPPRQEFWIYQEFQEKKKSPSVVTSTVLVMVAVFFVNSGWIELMFL